VLWLAVIGWKLRRKEPAYGGYRSGARGPGYGSRRDGDGSRRDGDGPRRDDDGPRGYGPRTIPDRPRRYDDGPRWDDDASEWDDDAPRWVEDPAGRDDGPPYEDGKPRRGFLGKRAEVEINPGKCMRFAFCEHEAPEVFKLQGDRIDYKPSVPPDQIDAVAMAVKVCPARAIKMKLPGSKPYLPQPPVDDDERRPVRR
jgi:ferredoxin